MSILIKLIRLDSGQEVSSVMLIFSMSIFKSRVM